MPQFYVSLANENGYHLRNVSYGQAKKLESTGEAVKICRRCGRISKKFCGAHGLSHDLAFQLTAIYRDAHQSSASLTLSDMLANVGQSTKDEMNHAISLGHERSARTKVAMWPFEHDRLAVMVCPTPA